MNIVGKATGALLSAVMLLSCTGCSKNEDISSEITPTETEPVVEEVSARVYVEGTKFMVNSKELWFSGVNTPWYNWNDFTGKMDTAVWEETFAKLAEDNINVTRIWINCAGENIVRLKSTGEIKEIKPEHWTDLDVLFGLAEKYGVYVMPTFLSFDHCKSPNTGCDKWRALLTDKALSDAYAETYVGEFCRRYNDNEYIFGIDLMNEPDWVHENEECGRLPWEDLSYFFGKCASVIHENSDMLVTVGLGMIKYNSDKYSGNYVSDELLKELTGNENAYLDFYSPHFYMWQKPYYGMPNVVSPEDFGLDGTKPCVIGEISNDDADECGMNLTEKYKTTHDNGWNGIMVWMEPRSEEPDKWYEYDLTAEATNAMNEYIPEKIYPNGKKTVG